MMTLSFGFFFGFVAMSFLWAGSALNVNNTVNALELLGPSLGYQSFIWANVALIQGVYVQRHTTFSRLPILVWCAWTVLSGAVLWSVLTVNGLHPYVEYLALGMLIAMGMCHWLGAAILNQRISYTSVWRCCIPCCAMSGFFLLVAIPYQLNLMSDTWWSLLVLVLGMSFTYGLSTSLMSKDIIPLERRRAPASMPLS
ncbi:MAG: hypothetical protein AAGF95_25555 [Chloroflexota bacterium]